MLFSLYGMHCPHMPALHWSYGYPCTLGVTAMSGIWLSRNVQPNAWLSCAEPPQQNFIQRRYRLPLLQDCSNACSRCREGEQAACIASTLA
jgi:hypothetical protein